MGIEPHDTDVFQLLKKLKDTNGTYPQELLAARRQGYLRQVAAVSAGGGLAAALKTTVKSTQGAGAGSLPTAGTLLEGLLVVAIVAEASTVAYFYRKNIVQLLEKGTLAPKVQEVTNPPAISSPIADFDFTPTPVVTADLTMTSTETITPVSTPSVLAELPATSQGSGPGNDQDSSSTNTQSAAVSTQSPNDPDNNHDDNGNHYGLTPKPIRTIDSGNPNNNVNTEATPRPGNGNNK